MINYQPGVVMQNQEEVPEDMLRMEGIYSMRMEKLYQQEGEKNGICSKRMMISYQH